MFRTFRRSSRERGLLSRAEWGSLTTRLAHVNVSPLYARRLLSSSPPVTILLFSGRCIIQARSTRFAARKAKRVCGSIPCPHACTPLGMARRRFPLMVIGRERVTTRDTRLRASARSARGNATRDGPRRGIGIGIPPCDAQSDVIFSELRSATATYLLINCVKLAVLISRSRITLCKTVSSPHLRDDAKDS